MNSMKTVGLVLLAILMVVGGLVTLITGHDPRRPRYHSEATPTAPAVDGKVVNPAMRG